VTGEGNMKSQKESKDRVKGKGEGRTSLEEDDGGTYGGNG